MVILRILLNFFEYMVFRIVKMMEDIVIEMMIKIIDFFLRILFGLVL